ncbi:glycoside hydrolase family 127 protein [Sphingomonas alpina]|uniref:Glycoside hydrolase family 127 protein n=1 Tax=Sphingomonas alpina TaxID=653931 RepID=A0A7H0LMF1_9SPHN|nr:beta-L-arabinofuranosidase domain-containing protein [Sphingomonas alpina]QNQ10854.1 glycoside hydrolase family 127 protein [Sphingomonas alpina]
MTFPGAGSVRLDGILGEALAANLQGRLSHFIVDETSPAIALFAPDVVAHNHAGDWYGEHAGKWLVAATRAAVRSGDTEMLAHVRRVADYLTGLQGADGYLGNYAPERRFMRRQPPKPLTWDGAPAERTWDIWTHSYLILGLIELYRQVGEGRYLAAARRIGDLCWRTLHDGEIDITDLGNHFGLSATVLIDPAVELYFATGEQRYLDLALLVLEQAEREPRNALLSAALAGADPSEIATGKAYQLLWNLVGIAKLHRATGEAHFLVAVRNLWSAIRAHHLTLGGGPWGGVAHRSREVFNPASVFSPHGYVETCSTMAWVQLNRELLEILGDAAFAQEIERSAYNDLLGAQAADGEDWCYYSFPNGRRTHTTYWRCCKSSGAMALEELPALAYAGTRDGGISINLLGPSEGELAVPASDAVRIEQRTDYPFDGAVAIIVTPRTSASFPIDIRIPEWARGASLRINGAEQMPTPEPGRYVRIERMWQGGDVILLDLPMPPTIHRAIASNVQESLAPDGEPVAQEVLRTDYLAVSRGPLIYATGLIDGFKVEETLRFAGNAADIRLDCVPAADGGPGPDLRLRPEGRAAIMFQPYYRAGGREDRSWRLTWMMLAPE